MFLCLSRSGAGVSRGHGEGVESVDQQARLAGQVRSEPRGFEVKEAWMVFKGPQVLQ